MAKDPEWAAHQQWLGYLQPVGLVVSPPALLQAQAHVDADILAEHRSFLAHVAETLVVGQSDPVQSIKDLPALLVDVFGWQTTDLVPSGDARSAALEVVLPEYHDTLRPTFAVLDEPNGWLLLIQCISTGTPLDGEYYPQIYPILDGNSIFTPS